MKISIPDLEALGFERRQGQGRYQGLCYNIWWRVHLEGEGANVRVTWELCEPGKQPFDQLGKQTNAKAVFMKGKEQMVHLSQEKSNPFVRRNV